MSKGQDQRSSQKGLGGFARSLSGLLVPKHVARAQQIDEQKREERALGSAARYVETKRSHGVIPVRNIVSKRGITKRPLGTVRAENRRRNKAAKKMQRRQ